MIDLRELEEVGKKLSSKFDRNIEVEDFNFDGVYEIIAFVNSNVLDDLNPLGHYCDRVYEINTKFFIRVRFYDEDYETIEMIYLELIELVSELLEDIQSEIRENTKDLILKVLKNQARKIK